MIEQRGFLFECQARNQIGDALVHRLVHVEIERRRIGISRQQLAGNQGAQHGHSEDFFHVRWFLINES